MRTATNETIKLDLELSLQSFAEYVELQNQLAMTI